MIIYIHGFASSGFGQKAQEFKSYFKNELITPSLSTIPKLAIHTLEELIEFALKKNEKVYLIGSSLGGFYSLYLSNKYNLKAVLINPALNPQKTLNRFYTFGLIKNYFDGSKFEITKEQLDSLENYEVSLIQNPENILCFMKKGDEIIDYKDVVSKLESSEIVLEEDGDHTFSDINIHFLKIVDFFFK